MVNNSDPQGPLASTLKQVFLKLENPAETDKTKLMDLWPEIAGKFFAAHTKARFIGEDKVIVWVDDSTMAFELSQRYKRTILKRLQNQFGDNKIKDIRFIVGELR